jgi:DNA-damage-inducible protein D
MNNIKLFESRHIRSVWDENAQKWYFAIVDVVSVLTASVDAGAYWRKLKERLIKEGNETVTNCHSLKMIAADGKQRSTDVADAEELLRLIQSIPSPKAEPFRLWLAKVGKERIDDIEDKGARKGCPYKSIKIVGPSPCGWPGFAMQQS